MEVQRSELYLLLGMFFIDADDYQTAIAILTKSSLTYPKNHDIYNARGVAYGESGQFDHAVEDFRHAIDLDNTDAAAHNNLGLTNYRLSRFEEAIECYDAAIRLTPKTAGFYANRGLAEYWLDLHSQAIADFDSAIELDPCDAEYYEYRGEALAAAHRSDESISDFDKVLELDPMNAIAYANRVWVMRLRDESFCDHRRTRTEVPDRFRDTESNY